MLGDCGRVALLEQLIQHFQCLRFCTIEEEDYYTVTLVWAGDGASMVIKLSMFIMIFDFEPQRMGGFE